MKTRFLPVIIFCTAIVCNGLAQTAKSKPPAKPIASKETALTNKTVIDLVEAGLDDGVVISKIQSSACRFDMSADGLISLKKAGVSSNVIRAMLDKSNGTSSAQPQADNSKLGKPAPASNVGHGIPTPDILSEVDFYNHKTNTAQPMEKEKASLTVRGIMGNSYNFEVDSAASPFRISSQDSLTFLVSMTEAMGEPAGWFTIYKLDVKKTKRSAVWVNTMATGKGVTKNIIDFKTRKLSNGVFEMIPAQKLEKGEYLFLAKGSMANYASRAADVFAFGVD